MDADLDPRTAGWEAQLDRLDDHAGVDDQVPPDPGRFDARDDRFGFHVAGDDGAVDEALADPLADEGEDHDDDAGTVGVLETLLVAFNHRDLDDLLDVVAADGEAPGLLGYDTDNLPQAIADLWERRPTVQLTRGRLERDHVAVAWEHDGAAWWQLAVVCIDDVRDGTVGVLEFADDPDLLDQVRTHEPEDGLLEGERWQEWEEGTDG